MRKIIILLLFLPLFNYSHDVIDSLKKLLPDSEQQNRIELFQELSQQYYEKSSDSCIIYARNAIDLANQLNNFHQQAIAYERIGHFFDRKKDDYSTSIAYLDTALVYFLKDEDYYKSTKTKILIADLYDLVSDYPNAFLYLNEAITSCDSLLYSSQDTNGIKLMYSDIFTGKGLIYKKLDSLDLSMQFINKALQYSLEVNDSITIAGAYCNIASIYQSKRENKHAVEVYKEAVKYMQKSGFDEHKASIYTNMGGILEYNGEIDSAFCYFQKAEPLFIKTDNKYNLSILYNCYGITYLNLEQYNKATEYFLKAIDVANSIDAGKLVYANYGILSNMYEEMGDYQQSIKYYKKYSLLKDSIAGEQAREKISNLEIKYNTEKKEKENQELKYNIELKEIALNKKNKEITIYLIVVFIVIILLSYILFLYRKKSRSYDALVQQNIKSLEIEKKLEQSMVTQLDCNLQQKSGIDKGFAELDKKLTRFMVDEKPYLWKQVTLDEFCKKLNTNRTYLSKLINEKYGQSFLDFISVNRIRVSRELLINPKFKHISIEGIGEMSGFKTNANFHKHFKELVQLTPKQFRDRALKSIV